MSVVVLLFGWRVVEAAAMSQTPPMQLSQAPPKKTQPRIVLLAAHTLSGSWCRRISQAKNTPIKRTPRETLPALFNMRLPITEVHG